MTDGKVKERRKFANFHKEKKEIQKVWNGLTINNSWETFITNMPHSISALERLMTESLRPTYFPSHGEPPFSISTPGTKSRASTESTLNELSVRSADAVMKDSQLRTLRPHLTEIMNKALKAFVKTVNAMKLIAKNAEEIPKAIETVLDVLNKPRLDTLENQLKTTFKKLQKLVENCARPAFLLESVFSNLGELYNGQNSKVGGTGLMLLHEVKHFFERITGFFMEVSKLVEFALDVSCNSLIKKIGEEVDILICCPKYVIKSRTAKEIYRKSLCVVVYSLVLRQIAHSYCHFTSQYMLPQINAIFQYSCVSNNELELKKTQEQFRELNMACRKEVDCMISANRLASKRPSVLEIDFGLNLHLSEIATEIKEALFTVATFPNKMEAKSQKDARSDNIKICMSGFVDRLKGKFSHLGRDHSNTL